MIFRDSLKHKMFEASQKAGDSRRRKFEEAIREESEEYRRCIDSTRADGMKKTNEVQPPLLKLRSVIT